MKKIIPALLIFLAAHPVLAITYTQVGHNSCREWTKERKNKTNSLQQTWLSGYVSGLDSTGYGDGFLKGSDDASIFRWMDKYCKAHPRDKLDNGVYKLVKELKSKTKK